MKRIALFVTLAIILSGAYVLNMGRNGDIKLIDALAFPVQGQDNLFVVTFKVQNDGPAKTLTEVHSSAARNAHVMNPGHAKAPIVIPANSNGIFAMDGAHIMVMGAPDDFVPGAFLPLTLRFQDYGEVGVRVLNRGEDKGENDGHSMDHSMAHDTSGGIHMQPSPTITLMAADGIHATGTEISVNIKNFAFVRVADGAPHVNGEGHGHVYLNGLKLARLYETRFALGAIPPGQYNLTVALNSHDHRPYLQGSRPVLDTLSFHID